MLFCLFLHSRQTSKQCALCRHGSLSRHEVWLKPLHSRLKGCHIVQDVSSWTQNPTTPKESWAGLARSLIVSFFPALRRTSESRLLAADIHGSAASSAALLVPPDECSILLEVSRSRWKCIACHQLNVSTPCARRVTHDVQCQRSHWIVRLPCLHCLLSKLTGRGLVVPGQRSPDCFRWFGWPGVRIKWWGQDLENVQQQCKIHEDAFIHHKKCAFFTFPNFPCLLHA